MRVVGQLETDQSSSSDIAAILGRARSVGESSWRVGIALGLPPADLARIESELDTAAGSDGAALRERPSP
jgi:hypothetical protein